MVKADTAVVVEVVPDRQGAEGGVEKGDNGHRPGDHVVVRGGHLQGFHAVAAEAPVQQGRQHGQGRQDGDQDRAAPQGPEAAQVLFEQRGVKERCL